MAQYQLNYSGSEINQLLAKISVLESNLNTLQTTVNNIDTSSIQSELNTVKQQVQSINDELDTKDATISNIQAKLTELENSINSLSTELSTKANTTDIPSLDGYATETYVQNKIAEASIGGGEGTTVDLSSYAKKTDILTSQHFGSSNYLDNQIYDFFDVSNRILNNSKSISGHIWSVSGPGENIACIENGELTTNTNFYATLDYGKTIKYMQITYHWDNIEGGNINTTDNIVMILQSTKGNLNNMIHIICGKKGLTVAKRINGGDFITLPTPVLEQYTLQTDKIYSTSAYLDGNKLKLIDAMGNTTEITDDDFLIINPTKMTIQIGPQDNSSYKGKFHSVMAGEKQSLDTCFAKNYGVSKIELLDTTKRIINLEGKNYTKKQNLKDISIPSSGWYTVAKSVTYGGNIMSGKLKINSMFKSNGSVTLFDADISYLKENRINISNFGYRMNQIIDKIRLGKDSNGLIYLDLHFKDSSYYPATLNLDFEGFFEIMEPIETSITYSNEYIESIDYPIPSTESIFEASSNSYYTVATQGTCTLGYQLASRCSILAQNAGGYIYLDCTFQASPGTMTKLEVTKILSNGTKPISNIRLSGDSSSKINLDICFKNAETYTTTVKIKFDECGYYTINKNLVGNVASLSPESKEKIIDVNSL